MERVYNFAPGPGVLPLSVLEEAQAELLDWRGTGTSVMEMSHRSKEFISIADQAEADLRELLTIPDTYKVLFLQGGASTQFAMVPLNLLGEKKTASYVNTGAWSKKAIAEGGRHCQVLNGGSGETDGFNRAPPQADLDVDAQAAYFHYTTNETIGGVEFHYVPATGAVPLVADMSSNILSRPLEVDKFDLIYAGAQKNMGPAGLTVVIVRQELIGGAGPTTPAMFNYEVLAASDSMYNTPPTFAMYMAGLVFKWLREGGGLQAMAAVNDRKAAKLYAAIDASDFYHNPVAPESRSRMNVPFTLANADLDPVFLRQAAALGLVTLKGHRSVGGMRASIYNAMPEAGVDALVAFMNDFEKSKA